MRYTITHAGVPIGTADLKPSNLAAGVLVPEAGYEAISDDVRAGTNALRARGLLDPPFVGPIDRSEVERATRLNFELRDHLGALVSTDWVNVFETPGIDPEYRVLARFTDCAAGVRAKQPPSSHSDPGTADLE